MWKLILSFLVICFCELRQQMSIFKNNILVCEILLVRSTVNAKVIKIAKHDNKYNEDCM